MRLLWMRNCLALEERGARRVTTGNMEKRLYYYTHLTQLGRLVFRSVTVSIAIKKSSPNHIQIFQINGLKGVKIYMKTCFHTLSWTQHMSSPVFQVQWADSWLDRTSPAWSSLRVGSKDEVAWVTMDSIRWLLQASQHKGNMEAPSPSLSTLEAGNRCSEWAPSKWEAEFSLSGTCALMDLRGWFSSGHGREVEKQGWRSFPYLLSGDLKECRDVQLCLDCQSWPSNCEMWRKNDD